MKIPPQLWSRHALHSALKNDHVTNNIAESFNHWVGELRPKPFLTLLDGLRAKLMNRLQIRYERGCRWDNVITPFVSKKLNTVKEKSRQCKLWVAGCNQFLVEDKNTLYTISLDTWTCDCRVWEVTEIPCRHATLAIAHKRDKLKSFTHPSFSKENYMKAYSHMIQAIPDPQFWPPMTLEPATILPPPLKRLLGRPRVNKRREVGEDGAIKRSGPIKIVYLKDLNKFALIFLSLAYNDFVGLNCLFYRLIWLEDPRILKWWWMKRKSDREINKRKGKKGKKGNKSAVISTTRGMRRGINTPIAPSTRRREEGQTSNIPETMALGSQPGLASVSSTQDTQM
ncbi:hypothetical protein Salat_1743900 [Sesamum alatum]|uniref:SWIM-type domain-containing protein n=1 Tax=Sesamum alatum TaxID=300844 RepID=A0AAE1Y886_9LAMI|nr:hypothetical protein Salat_1743900 [Sesamum alatum]